MGLKIRMGEQHEYERPEPGVYPARCNRVIDLGTQPGSAKYPNPKRKLMIAWELVGTRMEDGRPFTVADFFTNTMDERGRLRPILEGWRGRDFTEQEAQEFDTDNVLGAPCMLTLGENTGKNGRIYTNVVAVGKAREKIAECVNPLVMFNLEEPDWAVLDGLSAGLQNKIKASPEYAQARNNENGAPRPGMDDEGNWPTDDEDVPF